MSTAQIGPAQVGPEQHGVFQPGAGQCVRGDGEQRLPAFLVPHGDHRLLLRPDRGSVHRRRNRMRDADVEAGTPVAVEAMMSTKPSAVQLYVLWAQRQILAKDSALKGGAQEG